MSNIAEGHGYRSQKQFDHFLSIVRASGCEVLSLLYVVPDAEYIQESLFDELYSEVEESFT